MHLQQLNEMQSSRYEEGVPFVNRLYRKVLPFLCKKLYKRAEEERIVSHDAFFQMHYAISQSWQIPS